MSSPSGSRSDPYPSFNFLVEIDGIDAGAVAGFQEVTGLVSEVGIVAFREGTESTVVRTLPGPPKYANVTLKRGVTRSQALWDWHRAVLDGRVERRTVVITLLNAAREPVVRYRLQAAWPAKWQGPTLNALASEIAVEAIVIAHDGLEVEM